MPKLTDEERDYLNANSGCFKCRRTNVSHRSSDCPNGFPDGATYKPLVIPKPVKTAKVAAVIDNSVDLENVAAAIQRVAPLAVCSGVLSSGDDSISSDSDLGYVCPDLTSPHMIWTAIAHSPTVDASPIAMLIDSGCPTVLIREGVASQLKLRIRKLPEPFELGSAFGQDKSSTVDWVKLKVSSVDHSWSSHTCRALVVPSLCAPVILGLPFFRANKLLIDPANHALLDAASGRNILAPPPSKVGNRTARERREDEREEKILDRMWQETLQRDVNREFVLRYQDKLRAASTEASPSPDAVIAAVRTRVEELAEQQVLDAENDSMRTRFADLFPEDIPHVSRLPTDVFHRFRLHKPDMILAKRTYDCPKKYRDAWRTLLDQHLEAGRLHPSSSPYASPSFLIPKADPTALPRWVNDYRALNANTIPDAHPLPSIQEILSDCGTGKIWGKIDMTNSFFQTRVHPDDVQYTAVTTPFGQYEWTVMPQGCRNAPATHQRRMCNALRPFIGSICHVYLDDIIIWSQSLEEHRENVAKVLEALRDHSLFCSPKKTALFCIELDFLGHHISRRGVEADGKKVDRILDWPVPRSTKDVRAFLGLVRYIANFLPKLAKHTSVLTTLTTKEAEENFVWKPEHFAAFEAIKKLVTSRECLTSIDHRNMGNNRIFVSCDASDTCTGALLSYGETLETARPVAFESQQLHGAELNYPVHEKELYSIVRALKKWCVDLIGVQFDVYTDHRTLENFQTQKNLSRHPMGGV